MLNVVAWGGIGAANGGTEFANKITLLTVFIVKCEVQNVALKNTGNPVTT